RAVEPMPTDADSAKAALDRVVIPQDVLDRIAGIAPRSSLIVADEALSAETGKGTDVVVLLSGEPQGGIKSRRRSPKFPYARPARSPFLLALAFRQSVFRLVMQSFSASQRGYTSHINAPSRLWAVSDGGV